MYLPEKRIIPAASVNAEMNSGAVMIPLMGWKRKQTKCQGALKNRSAACSTPRFSDRKSLLFSVFLSVQACVSVCQTPLDLIFCLITTKPEGAVGQSDPRHVDARHHFLCAAFQMLISCLTALLIHLIFNHLGPNRRPFSPLLWIICSSLRANQ